MALTDGGMAPQPEPNGGLLQQMFDADKKQVPRDKPDPTDQRAALVTAWSSRVKAAKAHWDKAFKRMLDDQDFCIGKQWSKSNEDKRYVANIALRLVNQKTAFLYAKNPKAVARKRDRLIATAWNETQTQLQQVVQSGAMMAQTAMAAPPPQIGQMGGGMAAMGAPGLGGIMSNPAAMAAAQPLLEIAMDAARVKEQNDLLDKLGRTLELLYAYQISDQVRPFKSMMKLVVRRTVTCGVGYVKLGFERVMERRADMEKGIADASERLGTLERLAADMADQITDETDKEAEQLRLLIEDMSKQAEFVAREGLTFDFPLSTNIIPDEKTVSVKHWLGSDWVAEQFILSPHEVQEIYGVDIGTGYTTYNRADAKGPDPVAMARAWDAGTTTEGGRSWEDKSSTFACVWEIYSRKDGLVYVVCDGYGDFLREPASPEIYNERFYPWYALVFNECDHESEIFPPSDVRLIRDMQMEYNRCREGLKEQRIAARPFIGVVSGSIEEDDLEKLQGREANAIIELNSLQPNQDLKSLLQAYAGPGIDPNLYEVNPIWEDVLRTTGIQEANLGGTSDSTATQAQIAEGSRMTSMGSNIDDLNDLLTQLARNGGQILFAEMDRPQVEKIVGPGCVWPEISRHDISQEVLLEIEAGSMGRPNAAAEVANAQRLYPLLLQLPGIDPEFLAKDLLRRMDDKLDLTQAFKSMLPSVVAMNSMSKGMMPGTGPVAGQAQGPAGADNAAGPAEEPVGGPPDMTGQLAGVPPPAASGASPAPVGP